MVHSSVNLQAPIIFVYGTLKRGLVNAPAMRGAGSDCIQAAYLRGFRLFELPTKPRHGARGGVRPYPYPLLVKQSGPQDSRTSNLVLGELHRLGGSELHPDDALLVLDHLELEGYEYHRRAWWAVVRGVRVRAWVYVYASRKFAARRGARAFRGISWTAKAARLK
jgi:gamma-glutamylcyclotransferase (GGCT)/AIG2-like uncharacterized protein YtfP